MYFLFKMGIFHCYVSLPQGNHVSYKHKHPWLGGHCWRFFHQKNPPEESWTFRTWLHPFWNTPGATNQRKCGVELLMVQRSSVYQLRLVVYPIIYDECHPRWCKISAINRMTKPGFGQVSYDFQHFQTKGFRFQPSIQGWRWICLIIRMNRIPFSQ